MKFYNVIIVGGGPSGLVTGMTTKKLYPDKSVLLITAENKGLVPCGIPYVFHDLESVEKNEMGLKPFIDGGGEVLISKLEKVDPETKSVSLESGETISYEKLVFATGSIPVEPKSIEGSTLDGVEYIHKNFNYIKGLKEKVDLVEKIVVIGGGFIGVEVAEQIAKNPEKKVSLVEVEKYCLNKVFSEKLCEVAEEAILHTNIHVHTSTMIEKIVSDEGKVKGVKFSNGKEIEADLVIMATGYRPNTDLAEKTGLELSGTRAIKVDRYMRTSIQDISAVGDCSETIGFITGVETNVMLASTATAEARILAYNLFKIKIERHFPGTIGVFSTQVNELTMAAAGLNERKAASAKIDYVSGCFNDVDRHPGHFKDTSKLAVNLYVSPGDGSILGGEVWGGKSVGEIINIVGLAIQKNVNVFEFISYQIGTHPLLTGAPTKYALIKAAEDALFKMEHPCPD